METKVNSAISNAMETDIMEIESSFTRGFAGLHIVGNTSDICRDGKERAKAALETLNIFVPPSRILISLTPADVKKDGNQFDLPFALTLALLIRGRKPATDPCRWLFAGELGLSGEIKPTCSVISFAISAVAAGLEGIVVSKANLPELEVLARLNIPGFSKLKVFGFSNLGAVVNWLFDGNVKGIHLLKGTMVSDEDRILPNFNDMFLTDEMKKIAITCGSGMHSLLLRGCPGSGKSMFAARLPSILPKMTKDEHIECLRIQSAHSYKINSKQLVGIPPFRAPHHQASPAAILGNDEYPGELSLSHGGILFLDELPEFRRDILESLREPLETGEVRISRAKRKIAWKARLILVAAANNCACGWNGSKRRRCGCGVKKLADYRQKISGPILDRIDLHINFPEPKSTSAKFFLSLAKNSVKNETTLLSEHVLEARKFSQKRNAKFFIDFNRDLTAANILEASGLNNDQFLALVNKFLPNIISNRSVIKTMRVARTLADIDFSACIRESDLVQAWKWQSFYAAQERGEELLIV